MCLCSIRYIWMLFKTIAALPKRGSVSCAKRTWYCLSKGYSIHDDEERPFLTCMFMREAAIIYKKVTDRN